jgi:hypothetical protein
MFANGQDSNGEPSTHREFRTSHTGCAVIDHLPSQSCAGDLRSAKPAANIARLSVSTTSHPPYLCLTSIVGETARKPEALQVSCELAASTGGVTFKFVSIVDPNHIISG